ncbi:MAG: hypothetical protein HKN87_13930 [Saprospiraceae bacterium]|nr:hypothetical protein [Saprospiraceae bacterium]
MHRHDLRTPRGYICLLLLVFSLHLSCNRPPASLDKNPILQASYLLSDDDLPDYEAEIDHRAYAQQLRRWSEDKVLREKGLQIYRAHCYSCHGYVDQAGSLPDAHKFWQDTFSNGHDPLAMYQTITKGHGLMPAQMHLVPSEKYAVIGYLREVLIKSTNSNAYVRIDRSYLSSLPTGTSMGPEPKPYQPWADMDYGNWLMKCYEFAGADVGPKQISHGSAPLENEDYSGVNFAYKGIAMRLDSGAGGVAKGGRFAMFDHDLMRFVGAWSGVGFIDWEDILFDGQHNVYPRIQGEVMFHNEITPGWADPTSGSFADPRMRGADGRPFGPLPRSWAHYKGFYDCNGRMVIDYTVGRTKVLESYGWLDDDLECLVRTLTLDQVYQPLTLRLAKGSIAMVAQGVGVDVDEEEGYMVAHIAPGARRTLNFYLSRSSQSDLQTAVNKVDHIADLRKYIQPIPEQAPTYLSSPIIQGNSDDAYAVDVISIPFDNPFRSRIRPTGIDFFNDGQDAVVCTIDGEVWTVAGITEESGSSRWRRIATGMFQPLGIKVIAGQIYVSCRDQIALLHDLNGDGITDYYESFNSDHQVTEHFHEFAMGLQTDADGNFYYAKSGRHARKSLVPQHGTLLKVSSDGQHTTILANGFRAANGVCLNPDGSFYVTDQQGFWNPMNRINRVTPGGFYGNMWGYGAPQDSSDVAMQPPLCWVDMDYDRSPAELVWAQSDRWGPLNGSLLSLSYGYGKIYLVMTQSVDGTDQGSIVELPIAALPTGIMRGRINTLDGQLYICGMAAWATSRTLQEGGIYRIRYTGADVNLPLAMETFRQGVNLRFSTALDLAQASETDQYTVSSWDIKRTSKYGSDRYNKKVLPIREVTVSEDGQGVFLHIADISPSPIIEISYELKSADQQSFSGAIQGTVYALPDLEAL